MRLHKLSFWDDVPLFRLNTNVEIDDEDLDANEENDGQDGDANEQNADQDGVANEQVPNEDIDSLLILQNQLITICKDVHIH